MKRLLALLVVAGTVCLLSGVGLRASEPPATGPAVGERIPAFAALDQNGRERTFANLRGEEGLLILFHRSADW